MARSSDTDKGLTGGSSDTSEDRGVDQRADPLRPSDHIDSEPGDSGDSGITQPRLSPLGYLRFFWRQLTSMRTALLLLMLLALAAVPGSLVPQTSSDPNGVAQYKFDHPTLAPILDKIGLFNTFSTPWFSAVYLLLFVSLVGCIIPRVKHHLEALRSVPPKTPARLSRLAGFQAFDVPRPADPSAAPVSAEIAVAHARSLLRRAGYRTRIVGDSVSAERGYLRETGNLVFHIALLGILVTVGIGGGFGYTGQRVVVVGQTFSNVLGSYDSFNPGRFFNDAQLAPFNIKVDKFTVKYEQKILDAIGTPIEYKTDVTTTQPGATAEKKTIKVNEPLQIGGTNVYLLGNGYAVNVVVRDGEGNVALKDSIPFLPQDSNLTSLGVIKVPDALPKQLGMQGFFYPSAVKQATGAYASNYPDAINPLLSLSVYSGDLGLDDGVPQSVYTLETGKLKVLAGTQSTAEEKPITLKPGQTVKLPDGLGSIEFTGVSRFVSLDIHHDPSQLYVLVFAVLIVLGLLTGLFVPRRRVWVKAVQGENGLRIEYAGLARGEDPTLERAVGDLAKRHQAVLDPKSASDRRKVNP
ncbi:cytochrome c biogenesis protein [Frondihabitans sp. PhB188]|uniref:cytochrome c biogenesis protein ResB n=1 Tax=Frondihabitans sp. PhB188 TaxID=2485200 RepID=UPI000F46819C|nr:cytochrome c biogenesis protein ResB [Frondihabitans sp. PhB188]ROQ39423.1 cytochrome c biogenesis protein [Frondihabitans sp. PhB188]